MELTYFDRGTGQLCSERVYARAFLHWLYNTRSGTTLARLLTLRWASRLYGWANRRPLSRRRIRPFVERMGIDLGDARKGIDDFASFSDFFVRELKPGRRPVCDDPAVCIAPSDGRVLAYARVDAGTTFRIKRSVFDLTGLLRNDSLAATFAGGSMVVSRLGLADYHHFHFPDSGVPAVARRIDGRLHAGGPYARRSLVPFFTENHRMVTPFASDHFGLLAQVEVGALTVGSIRQRFEPGTRVGKGDPKGWFELGGSTVVLLFREGAIALDPDLLRMTARGIETHLRMGEPLGWSALPEGKAR